MQTQLATTILATSSGRRADEILRACVHCGFCNATCPTYLLTGDELDGPRGRIYLVKEMLEADSPSVIAREHLDRCLTCRACETTCPSGVAYGELAEIGRNFIAARARRPLIDRWIRALFVRVLPAPRQLRFWARLGRYFRWLLPAYLRRAIPKIRVGTAVPVNSHTRRVVVLDGCVQRSTTPEVNSALANVLDRAGVQAVRAPGEVCCGSLALHLGEHDRAMATMRANVDLLYIAAADAEAIVSSASGCGVTVKDYGRLLAADPEYAERARWVADKTCDAAEYLLRIDAQLAGNDPATHKRVAMGAVRVAWHQPCSLLHGQRISGVVETLLQRAGYQLVPVANAHLCCGSAGTYSVLQHTLGDELRRQKLAALTEAGPDVIVTANVGCQLHLRDGASVPVRHWLELLG